jgi:hypothetical protein
LLHCGAAAEVEELLVHAVEEPRKRGDGEDESVLARHQFIPRLVGAGGGGWSGGHKVRVKARQVGRTGRSGKGRG